MGMFGLARLSIHFFFFVFPFFFFVLHPATSVTSNPIILRISIKNFLSACNVDLFFENLSKYSYEPVNSDFLERKTLLKSILTHEDKIRSEKWNAAPVNCCSVIFLLFA